MPKVETVTGGRKATRGVIPGGCALSVGNPGTKPPSGFRWARLLDLARLESGHTPSRRVSTYWSGDIPWIGIKDATRNHGRVICSTNESVTRAGIANSSARILPPDTVCLSRTASVGYVVTMGRPMATSQDFINWVCGDSLRARYLHYIFLAEQESIRRFATGSVHPTVYYPEAKAFHVCIPDTSTQEAILSILEALDDKIEVNERIATTCHELAQAYWRRARTQACVGVLAEVARITMGSSPPGESYNESGQGLPFYQGTRDFGPRYPRHRVWCVAPVRTASPGSTLVSVRAPVGRLNLAKELCCIGRGVASLASTCSTPSVLFHTLTAAPEVWTPFESEGTVFGAINKRQLEGLRIPVLADESGGTLESILSPLDRRVASAHRENEALATLRDMLLPKLMSGEIRVGDAEKVVEEAT
jgi:type I restriction enzyme S subunit